MYKFQKCTSMESASGCLKVAVAVIIIQLTSDLACGTQTRPPLCANQGELLVVVSCQSYYSTTNFSYYIAAVVFTEYPRNMTVPCKSNTTAMFPCQYTYHNSNGVELPRWTIGSTTYSIDYLPLYHRYDSRIKELYVRISNISQNNTVYICEFHTIEDGQLCVYRSEPGSIVIVNSCEGKLVL